MSDPEQVRLADSLLDRNRHVCALLQSNHERYRVLHPFIRTGLDEGDQIRHLLEPRNREEQVRRLDQAGTDVADS